MGSLGRTGKPPDAHTPPPLPPGLCGNFNQNQADDFRTVGGVVEATAAAFANTWKTQDNKNLYVVTEVESKPQQWSL